jgi:integrase
MPTFRKRKTRWSAQVRRKGYSSISKTFALKRDAEVWAYEIERKIERGEWSHSSSCDFNTFGDLLNLYLSQVVPHKKGHESEYFRIKTILRSELSELKISEVNSQKIAQYRDHRQTKVSGSSVRKEMQIISHAWNTARNEWLLDYPNPVNQIRKPKENKRRERRLEAGEEKILLQSAKQSLNPHLVPLIIFAIETGMRRSELLGSTKDDLMVSKKYLRIETSKNGSGRDVPLSAVALSVVERQLQVTNKKLFPLSPTALRGLWSRVCKRAGLKNLHFHDLRHEATTRFFEKGLNVMEVAAITGHKDLRMLQRYTHLKAEDLAKKLI